ADFLRVDQHLIDVAAEASEPGQPDPRVQDAARSAALAAWVRGLPEAEKNELLIRLLEGDELRARREAWARVRQTLAPDVGRPPAPERPLRTVGDLYGRAEELREEAQRREAAKAEKQRREEAARQARKREAYLTALADREEQTWAEIDQLVASKVQA